ncbi:patatin family protein [Clostridia bacterium]|nr:patatin family protein [Clostridia bacterium]
MKLGITMEGGASRTSFSCGVTDAFLEEDLMPDYFIGVSAGIAFGMSYLSKQKGRNLELMQKFMPDKRYAGFRHLFNRKNKSFYNIPFVFDEIPRKLLPFDYEAFENFKGQVVAAVTNIHTGKAEYLNVPRNPQHFHLITASCALPVFFQPVKVGKRYYLDGGIADSIPYKQAIGAGCDKNIIILTREQGYVKTKERGSGASMRLYKRYPNLAESLKRRPAEYNATIAELWAAHERGEVFVIAPETTFGMGRTESRAEKLTRLYEEGYRYAKEIMPELKAYLAKDNI